jgi:hypothetical protein
MACSSGQLCFSWDAGFAQDDAMPEEIVVGGDDLVDEAGRPGVDVAAVYQRDGHPSASKTATGSR